MTSNSNVTTTTSGISNTGQVQFKPPTAMPNDQLAKLIEMHKKSAENAGIYVAVVLIVYVVLLSLLLCRYVRRRPTTRELPSLTVNPSTTAPPLVILKSCPIICLSHSVALLSAIRHCSFTRGAGVSSLSSDSKEDPDEMRRLSQPGSSTAALHPSALQLNLPVSSVPVQPLEDDAIETV